ncbi:MAG: hypothetical protein QNJ32_29555 [Xenococcaceae cyanobacterium MO_167.B27]|nr:hypothetical protein [Xenococcaceae cyanobacterium MO_167.B27]
MTAAQGAIFDGDASEVKKYQKHLKAIAKKKDKDKDWIKKYLRLEFGDLRFIKIPAF